MSAMDWAGTIGAGILAMVASILLYHAEGGGAIVMGLIVSVLGYLACQRRGF